MGVIQDLFSQYSIEALIIIVIAVAVVAKYVLELIDWFKNKMSKHFGTQVDEDRWHEEIMNNLKGLKESSDNIDNRMSQLDKRMSNVELRIAKNTDRLQENARSWLIDKHHYFCYKVKYIDDASLEVIERRYLYYKSDGGNSYIDTLMDDIRNLPRHRNYEGSEDQLME